MTSVIFTVLDMAADTPPSRKAGGLCVGWQTAEGAAGSDDASCCRSAARAETQGFQDQPFVKPPTFHTVFSLHCYKRTSCFEDLLCFLSVLLCSVVARNVCVTPTRLISTEAATITVQTDGGGCDGAQRRVLTGGLWVVAGASSWVVVQRSSNVLGDAVLPTVVSPFTRSLAVLSGWRRRRGQRHTTI